MRYVGLLCFLLYQFKLKNASYSCTLAGAENVPRRDAYCCGEKRIIVLQESGRLQHRLMNALLAILFTERLGYKNVTTSRHSSRDFNEIMDSFLPAEKSRSKYVCQDFPQVLVNVGVEVPVMAPGKLFRVATLGYTGATYAYRWYMHPATGACPQARYLQYYALPQSEISTCFNNAAFLDSGHRLLENRQRTTESCDASETCPVVLSSFKNETNFMIDHVKKLKLRFTIIWLEKDLYNVINELAGGNETFFVVDDLLWPNLVKIITPDCETLNKIIEPRNCPYDLKQQTKLVWYNTNSYFPIIYSILQNFTMTDLQVYELTQEYIAYPNRTIESAACTWLNSPKNKDLISTWISSDIPKPEKYIVALYCLNDAFSLQTFRKVTTITENFINYNVTYSFKLRIIIQVISCSTFPSAGSVKKLFDIFISKVYPKIIGLIVQAVPSIDVVTELSSISRTPIITFSPNGPSFKDRKTYPNVFRTAGEKNCMKKAYLKFFEKYEWNRIAAISSYNQSNTNFISILKEYFYKKISFVSETITDETSIKKCLENLKSKDARILLVEVESGEAEALFLAAHALDMVPERGYVWVLPDWAQYFHLLLKQMPNDTQAKIKQVISHHFSLSFSSISNEILSESSTIKAYRNKIMQEIKVGNAHIGFLADAIWVLAEATENLITQHRGAEDDLHGDATVKKFSEFINNRKPFEGISGKIEFYEGSVRTSQIEVKHWTNEVPQLLAITKVNADNEFVEWQHISDVKDWGTKGNSKPIDGTIHCIFQISNEFYFKCYDMSILAIIIAFAVLVFVFLTTAIICSRRNKKELKELMKLANNHHTDIMSRLHSFEVPRDNIEMSWEIGKGSFGKVFGGYLKTDDDSWSQVAIKLLKCDANAEDENDFLCEAKTMASFEHKNIVKLMAVCTAGTPILIVMELMLHEDLKKFLITKRHLVDDPDCVQMKCISPHGLTQMALDVAMALSYLADKKFVHRDIASRNCMVNARGVVKLGDFGMARYVFSRGEYLCKRKALFPVRWMAPESLSEGTFTSMSDVWSYGVLLYEIITFGEAPYRNLKDSNDVKEFVITGNVIRLPFGVDPQLRWLIEQCWSYDDKRRPSAADVVVYLADRPTLLHACLEQRERVQSKCHDAAAGTGGSSANACYTADTATMVLDVRQGCDTATLASATESAYEEVVYSSRVRSDEIA